MKESIKKSGVFDCNMIKKGIKVVFLFFCFTLFFNFILAASSGNITQFQEAELCLNNSKEIMDFLVLEGFETLRINDTLRQANSLFEAQKVFMERKRNYDFSQVINYCNKIKELKKLALESRDSLSSLMKFYNISISEDMNTSTIDATLFLINSEIKDERYENIEDLIERAYSEISYIQASQTTLKIFYSSTARGLKNFLVNNWITLLILLCVLLVAYFLYRVKVAKYLINRKIEGLRLRKKTLQELIMKTQLNYFQKGTMPEGEYNIKTKRYAEMVRDIDRQIPLLQEQLAKVNKKV